MSNSYQRTPGEQAALLATRTIMKTDEIPNTTARVGFYSQIATEAHAVLSIDPTAALRYGPFKDREGHASRKHGEAFRNSVHAACDTRGWKRFTINIRKLDDGIFAYISKPSDAA